MSSSSTTTTTNTDTCNSLRFSWLMKSCFPQNLHHPSPLSSSATSTTTISALPDDILLECLARVPHSSLPTLLSVCRRWAHLLNSPSFLLLRPGGPHHTLFSLSISNSTLFSATLRPNHRMWKLSSFLAQHAFPNFPNFKLVSIGRKIYVISRTAMLRWDTWTGTIVPKAEMSLSRKKFAVAAVAGKIYVAGGCARSSGVEEYDPEENVWRVVTDAPRRRYGCIGASVDGLFCVIGGLKIGNDVSRAARAEEAHLYASTMDLYDVSSGAWLRSRGVPGGGCVVAACAASDGNVYILSSHAVELSFWRFNASRKSVNFGAWCRIKSPPLPPQVGLDSAVRFSCVGMADTVVLVQVAGCVDDVWRRTERRERGSKNGMVLVYDCGGGEWSRGPDLPEVIRRAACVCVEC